MNTKIRTILKDGEAYRITFDGDGVLDTVESRGKFLPSTNSVVRQIIKHADEIRAGYIPDGFKRPNL